LNDDDAVLPDFHDRWENILSQVIVTEQEVIDILCTLNANKAVGTDIISNRMVVSVKEEMSLVLPLMQVILYDTTLLVDDL
jgi:hypothetical protein